MEDSKIVEDKIDKTIKDIIMIIIKNIILKKFQVVRQNVNVV